MKISRPLQKYRGFFLFVICLLVGICMHIAGIFLVDRFPSSLFFAGKSPPKKSTAHSVYLTSEKEPVSGKYQELKEFFNPALLPDHALDKPFDLETLFLPRSGLPFPENFTTSLPNFTQCPWMKNLPVSEEFIYHHPTLLFPTYPLTSSLLEDKFQIFSPSQLEIDFSREFIQNNEKFALLNVEEQISLDQPFLDEERNLLSNSPVITPLLNPIMVSSIDGLKKVSPVSLHSMEGISKQEVILAPGAFSSCLKNDWQIPAAPSLDTLLSPVVKNSSPSMIEYYELPEIFQEIEWNENHFNAKTYLMPHPEEKGYIFSVAIQPCEHASCKPLKQSFHFVVDRTNSIEKHRFNVYKKAVSKALAYLTEGDQFNIYILDKKCLALSKENLLFNQKTLKLAQEFLEEQEFKSFFSSGDIYESLDKLLSQIEQTAEVNTVILITDGKTSLSRKSQQKILDRWAKKDSDKLHLYAAAAGRENNLMLLDFITSQHGGRLLYSETHAAFPRKLAKLILTLKQPLATELKTAIIPQDQSVEIQVFPSANHLPVLCSQHPYVLIGRMDRLTDFTLVIQGMNHEQPISLKIPVSLDQAKKGGKQLEKKWAVKQASLCFEKFLLKGNNKDLKEANELISTHGREIAYE